MKPKEFDKLLRQQLEIEMTYQQAWSMRQSAIEAGYRHADDAYQQIMASLYDLSTANPQRVDRKEAFFEEPFTKIC